MLDQYEDPFHTHGTGYMYIHMSTCACACASVCVCVSVCVHMRICKYTCGNAGDFSSIGNSDIKMFFGVFGATALKLLSTTQVTERLLTRVLTQPSASTQLKPVCRSSAERPPWTRRARRSWPSSTTASSSRPPSRSRTTTVSATPNP